MHKLIRGRVEQVPYISIDFCFLCTAKHSTMQTLSRLADYILTMIIPLKLGINDNTKILNFLGPQDWIRANTMIKTDYY